MIATIAALLLLMPSTPEADIARALAKADQKAHALVLGVSTEELTCWSCPNTGGVGTVDLGIKHGVRVHVILTNVEPGLCKEPQGCAERKCKWTIKAQIFSPTGYPTIQATISYNTINVASIPVTGGASPMLPPAGFVEELHCQRLISSTGKIKVSITGLIDAQGDAVPGAVEWPLDIGCGQCEL